jgi:hypothetical protein
MRPELRSFALVALTAAAALGACRPSDRNASSVGDTAAAADTASGMAGMQGMSGMMGTATMDSMEAHLRMMDTMRAEQFTVMLPAHRRMVANMLSRMNQEMRSMNMAANQAWTSTVDSLRQDLVRMPEMSGTELREMMPAHHARMTRLMQMHRDMMGRVR